MPVAVATPSTNEREIVDRQRVVREQDPPRAIRREVGKSQPIDVVQNAHRHGARASHNARPATRRKPSPSHLAIDLTLLDESETSISAPRFHRHARSPYRAPQPLGDLIPCHAARLERRTFSAGGSSTRGRPMSLPARRALARPRRVTLGRIFQVALKLGDRGSAS